MGIRCHRTSKTMLRQFMFQFLKKGKLVADLLFYVNLGAIWSSFYQHLSYFLKVKSRNVLWFVMELVNTLKKVKLTL